MRGFTVARSVALLVAGSVVVGSLALALAPLQVRGPFTSQDPLSFWEAAGRGLVSVVMVDESYQENGNPVTLPVGIRVTNAADVPVVISEEAVLMSPHPSQSPAPNPLATTQDAVLSMATIPAHGSVLYSYGTKVMEKFLPGPMWWCLEEMEVSKPNIAFRVGGETLPFALRAMVEHPFYHNPTDNTQMALWRYLRSVPTVVIGKQPLWSTVDGSAGQTVRVRIDATNLAVWATDDTFTQNVNLTRANLTDDVPAGWSVQAGSYSVPPDVIVSHPDGSRTLVWHAALPAAQVSQQSDTNYPTGYATVTRFYTLVAPALSSGNVTLPRAGVGMNDTGTVDAHSAPVVILVTGNAPPIADAGGPYSGKEGDTILLNASRSHDPEGDPLQFRWSYTDNGTWDTAWSSSSLAAVRYTDEFSGKVRVEVTDGHTTGTATAPVTIANVPPRIEGLTAFASANFSLVVAGTKSTNVTVEIHANGTVLGTLNVVRQPGDPKAQAAHTGMLVMNLSRAIFAKIHVSAVHECERTFPMWLNATLPDGRSFVLLRNVHARDDDDAHVLHLQSFFFEHGITLRANLSDPGADTLTAFWDFGDGTNATQVFPNGPANDSPEQPVGGHAPMNVTATVVHAFREWEREDDDLEDGGPFIVTLTVTDADGGRAVATLTLPLPSLGGCAEGFDD